MNTIIKLAPGNIGWFDPLTSIHLTLSKTEAIVKTGMNTTNIKNALSEGKIIIKQGTIETSKQIDIEPFSNIKTEEKRIITTSAAKKEKVNSKNKAKKKSIK